MVIGTFAYCGSGQDTLADGFCKCLGFLKYSMGDIVRNIARSRNLPMKREVLQNIRKEYDLKYGRDFVVNAIVDLVHKSDLSSNRIVITGIRTREECQILKDKLGMKLIFVYADEGIRYQRMLKRNDEKDENILSELKNRMKIESELFDYPVLEQQALLQFDFNMPLEEYKKNERKIIEELFLKIAKEE